MVTCTERSRWRSLSKSCIGIRYKNFWYIPRRSWAKKTNDIELIQTMSQGMPVALPLGGRGFSWTND
ncbi:hypothetical protein [Nostoc flagelliforme]|uniref:hypothetical protein n=1 Tax=Nostoc flagelliforme TaxID=1306274 RepID=UPI0030DA6CB5